MLPTFNRKRFFNSTGIKRRSYEGEKQLVRAAFNPAKRWHSGFLNGNAGALKTLLCDVNAGSMTTEKEFLMLRNAKQLNTNRLILLKHLGELENTCIS